MWLRATGQFVDKGLAHIRWRTTCGRVAPAPAKTRPPQPRRMGCAAFHAAAAAPCGSANPPMSCATVVARTCWVRCNGRRAAIHHRDVAPADLAWVEQRGGPPGAAAPYPNAPHGAHIEPPRARRARVPDDCRPLSDACTPYLHAARCKRRWCCVHRCAAPDSRSAGGAAAYPAARTARLSVSHRAQRDARQAGHVRALESPLLSGGRPCGRW